MNRSGQFAAAMGGRKVKGKKPKVAKMKPIKAMSPMMMGKGRKKRGASDGKDEAMLKKMKV